MSGCDTFVLLLLLCAHSECKRASPRRRRELVAEAGGPTGETAEEAGLFGSVSAATVFEKSRQWHRDTSKKQAAEVLAYVTPWNRRGYELATVFRAKLDYVSPVWYQLRREQGDWILAGGHEYDEAWIQGLRQPVEEQGGEADTGDRGDSCQAKGRIQLVPRVVVELSSAQDHIDLLESREALGLMASEVAARDYDGMVLEVYTTWVSMNGIANDGFRARAFAFIKSLHGQLAAGADSSSKRRRKLILAVPPLVPSSHKRPYISPDHMSQLAEHVDGWSIMTYDYANGAGPQPNAPLPWLEQNLALLDEGAPQVKHAAMMGLNFYGYDYAAHKGRAPPVAITSDAYLVLLAAHQPELEWRQEHKEHSFAYTTQGGEQRVVFFPSVRSIRERLELFNAAGVSVSIWELGQGVERFFDAL